MHAGNPAGLENERVWRAQPEQGSGPAGSRRFPEDPDLPAEVFCPENRVDPAMASGFRVAAGSHQTGNGGGRVFPKPPGLGGLGPAVPVERKISQAAEERGPDRPKRERANLVRRLREGC